MASAPKSVLHSDELLRFETQLKATLAENLGQILDFAPPRPLRKNQGSNVTLNGNWN